MILLGSWSELLQPPVCAAENEQGEQVSHCAFHRRDLHRLVLGLDDAEVAADDEGEDREREQHAE